MAIAPNDRRDDENDPSKRVVDEEGTVDQKVKERVLRARERVDDAEARLYVDAPTSDRGVSQQEQYIGYTTMVKQFIRAIKPLLTSDKIERSDYYFHEVSLLDKEVPPPDGRYPWSRFYFEDTDPSIVKRDMGLRHVEPPEPKTVEIRGLKEVLREEQQITLRWSFDLQANSGNATTDIERLQREIAIPKSVFDLAVEEADAFLQQAGIGLEIGHRQTDEYEEEPV